MPRLKLRRLAAVDMHGSKGTTFRRRVIVAEFILGAVALVAVGVWSILGTNSIGWQVLGAWSIGVGLNYVPMALYAILLTRPGALRAELDGVDLAEEARHYTVEQIWIFVPLLFVVFAIRQVGRAS